MIQVSVFYPSTGAAVQARQRLRKIKGSRKDTATVYDEAPSDRRVKLKHTRAVRGALWGSLAALAAALVGALAAPAIHTSVLSAALIGLPIGALYGFILGFVSHASQPAFVPAQEGAGAVVIVDAHSIGVADQARNMLAEAPDAMTIQNRVV